MPVSVTPSTSSGTTISCSPTVQSCPDASMQLTDSYGNIVGCKSSCYAQLDDSAVQVRLLIFPPFFDFIFH
jgi:hypothetical protein